MPPELIKEEEGGFDGLLGRKFKGTLLKNKDEGTYAVAALTDVTDGEQLYPTIKINLITDQNDASLVEQKLDLWLESQNEKTVYVLFDHDPDNKNQSIVRLTSAEDSGNEVSFAAELF